MNNTLILPLKIILGMKTKEEVVVEAEEIEEEEVEVEAKEDSKSE